MDDARDRRYFGTGDYRLARPLSTGFTQRRAGSAYRSNTCQTTRHACQAAKKVGERKLEPWEYLSNSLNARFFFAIAAAGLTVVGASVLPAQAAAALARVPRPRRHVCSSSRADVPIPRTVVALVADVLLL